jgi:extracellular elastinolytic metalloproteinase
MRLTLLRRAALVAAVGALALPASALAVANIHESQAHGLGDYDARVGKLAPTKGQKAAVKRLHAKVTWNRFGTPETISKRGKYLAKRIRGKTAPEAARRWLHRNRALFKLTSTSGLELAGDTQMPFSRGHAVNFRQVVQGLETTDGGLITIGLTGSAKKRWNVAYVSSSLTRNTTMDGRGKLSAVQAWLRAADAVGVDGYSVVNVKEMKFVNGWQGLAVSGMRDVQRVRPVAFPKIRSGVAPAFETIVLKGLDALGYKIVVDATTGALLTRTNLVHNLAKGETAKAAAESYSFEGEIGPADGDCQFRGPFAIGAGNRALDGFADATVPANDLVLELWKDGALVPGTHADTFLTPERFRYEPTGGVPAGDYQIRVCDFDDAAPGPAAGTPWVAPRTYSGTLKGDASAAPPAFLARWKVFPANPPLHTVDGFPWNHPDADTRETWCWVAAPGCDRTLGQFPLGARGPWDHDHKLNASTLTTRGNNAKSATSWTNPFFPSPPQYQPVSAGRDYSYPWTNDWNNRQCNPDPGATSWDQDAATVNLFVAHNRMHDWSYYLGFTERNWNAQDYNFGLTERRQENDPIIGNVQAGAQPAGGSQRNNANMITLPDGQSSVTNMYFWQPQAAIGPFYAPCVDGDYDMGVIGHEYGHMIENRMIGKGNVRSGHPAGAMGESHGDMFGMEYLFGNGFVPTSNENPYANGTYDTGNKLRAIRNFGMNFPTSGGVPEPSKQLNVNTLNFSDMGYDLTGPTFTSSQQVHANGEIWSKTNFVIRQLLVDKYNDDFPYDDEDLQYACANGELPPYACPGNRRWIQLVFDAMLLMPTNATMLEARDAALAADLMRFGGSNQRELWLGYARQGMGVGATTTHQVVLPVPPPPAPPPNPPCSPCGTLDETDTDPTPDWESPLHDNGTITFAARARDGTAITNARFYVGHYEARVSPIADTNPATTGANLDNVAKMAPGSYEFTVNAPGYGFFRFRKTVDRGRNSTFEVRLAQNVASANAGAVATGDTNGADAAAQAATLRNLIDDTERTQWETPGNATGPLSVDGKKVTIDLAGADPVKVRKLQVSAMLRNLAPAAGQSRFTALRQFEVWACNGDKANCSIDAGFTKVYTSPADAFPGNSPRPVSPHLILRSFDIPNTKATHLRLVVKTNQCTGGPNFLGEQDADPGNLSDCPTGGAAVTKFVRAAEFQAFAEKSSVYRKH